MGELNEMVGTAIPRALKHRLLAQAKRERRSMSQIIRLAIEQYLKEHAAPPTAAPMPNLKGGA